MPYKLDKRIVITKLACFVRNFSIERNVVLKMPDKVNRPFYIAVIVFSVDIASKKPIVFVVFTIGVSVSRF